MVTKILRCTVTDSDGDEDSATLDILVIPPNTPPVVTASLEPICGEDDEGLFRVVFSAEDAENNITSLLVELNGIPVENGQVVDLELDEEFESEFDDGILEIEAPSFTLTVTATDSEGASDTATSSAEFSDLVECDDGDDDEDDDDDEDEED